MVFRDNRPFNPEDPIIVNIKLRNQRMYEVAWAIAKLKGYETLDDFINDAVLDAIEMVPGGRGGPGISDVEWGFKTTWDLEKEQGKQAKMSAGLKSQHKGGSLQKTILLKDILY